jgi:hypothetical protein
MKMRPERRARVQAAVNPAAASRFHRNITTTGREGNKQKNSKKKKEPVPILATIN